MTKETKRAAWLARQRAISAANNVARGLDPLYSHVTRTPARKPRKKRVVPDETFETRLDNLGESHD